MTTEFQAQLDGESVHCYGSIGNARGSLAETKPNRSQLTGIIDRCKRCNTANID
jgi:hypothetical protein